jgi:homoserine O-acetyltransferase/O-succinyltransferase
MSTSKVDLFTSSDTSRHAQPLRYAKTFTSNEPLPLENGGQLPHLTVVYETHGLLDAQAGNAVLVCHALSGDSHVARHDDEDDPGWWDLLVGPGKAIDTDKYFVICPNILGGCRGTTGPNSINPATGRPYGADFPLITVGDIVTAQRRLVEHLGIQRLLGVVGGSLGGHMVLDWATRFPTQVAGALAIATSPCLTSQALAFDIVGRNAILRDSEYQSGQYYGNGSGPVVGLALARMLGHITYLSREAMMQKFDPHRAEPHNVQTQFETRFSVGSYLAYQGDKFVERFDANSYLTLTMAIDIFNLGDTREQLTAAVAATDCRWLLMSFSSDWLFPPFQSQQIVDALIAARKPVSYCCVQTRCGHDAFLLPNELATYGELVRAFLDNLYAEQSAAEGRFAPTGMAVPAEPIGPASSVAVVSSHEPTSIFHHRFDYDSITSLIPPDASVLDLGCGTGGLLARLRENGHTHIMGIELDEKAILACVRRGLHVIQADLNEGLSSAFADRQFDFVVLSQTLQAVIDVPRVVADMLRVGRQGIVSFPNLAYHKLRSQLAERGRAPQVGAAEGFHWYDTPDVRFFSIADFEEFCRDHAIHVHQRIALNTESDEVVTSDANRNADVAIFVISQTANGR